MCPNDAVATSDSFSTWIQNSHMTSGVGCVRFSSPTGLNLEHACLRMSNNLCFLEIARCNMKNNSASNAETINSLTTDLQHNIWNQRLGHLGKKAFRKASLVRDGVPKLQRHPLFKCGEFIKANFYKCEKGCRTKNDDHKLGEIFQMDYGFVRGKKHKESEINNNQTNEEQGNKITLKPCRNLYDCCLLTTDAFTRRSWVFPFADKKPPVSTVNYFLKKCGKPNGTARTDEGG